MHFSSRSVDACSCGKRLVGGTMPGEIRETQKIIRNSLGCLATTGPIDRMILPRNSIYDGPGCCFSVTSSAQTSSTFFRLGLKQLKMRRLLGQPTCSTTMFSAHI